MQDDSLHAHRSRELGRFLRHRRSRLQPHDVGLTPGAGKRRVAGLRREEVATLAGVGVKWYTMLENGAAEGVSAATLERVARALLLGEDETAYLHNLVGLHLDEMPNDCVPDLFRGTLHAIEWAPAYVCTAQWMVLDWNRAMSVVWNIEPPGGAPFNLVRRMFTDPAMRALHGDRFTEFASRLVAMVRVGAGRLATDPVYRDLYADLQDDQLFSTAWDSYAVASPFSSFPSRIVSPKVGEFVYEALSLLDGNNEGYSIVVQVPDDSSAARLRAALAET